ncbi:MAG: hypothetical protein N3E39_00895 [Candidatus Methanomethylicia archaeon]|nr:hypothetical protein [Candidatus Methanomethylicia archaeon]MDW7988504.1 hypothetical protein [Nitrososphaerota archaeon]
MKALKDLSVPFIALTIFLTPFAIYILNSRSLIGEIESIIIDIIILGVGAIYLYRQLKK